MGVTMAPNHAGEDTKRIPRPAGVFSIEEFLSSKTATQAQGCKAEEATPSAKKRTKAVQSAPREAVALGSRTSKYTVDLHAKYQALGIPQPVFDFYGSSDGGWSGRVSFPGLEADELQDIKDETCYSSKQQAKEELSKRAFEILTRLEQQGRIQKVSSEARVTNSRYRVALHAKCQKDGLPQPEFEYTGDSESGWSAEIIFPGIELDALNMRDETRFPSKQKAREAVSKAALEALEIAESQGKLENYGKGGKAPAQTEKSAPEKNYVGMLLEYLRANKAPQPLYTDYQIGTQFACQLTLELASANPCPQTFGSLDCTRPTKKAARREAARCAIEHLISQGVWHHGDAKDGASNSDDGKSTKGIKNKKTPKRKRKQNLISPSPSPSSLPIHKSYAQHASSLATILCLGAPEWRFQSTSNAPPDFHTVACYFPAARGTAHAGPIGVVANVRGRRRAKEECARLVVEYLEGVWGGRVGEMEGLGGGKREGEGGGDVMMDEGGGEGEEESEEGEFEDAMEDME